MRRHSITLIAVIALLAMTGCAKYHPCISVDGELHCYGHTFPKKEALGVAKAVGSVVGADGYTAVKDDARYKAENPAAPVQAAPAVSRPRPDSDL